MPSEMLDKEVNEMHVTLYATKTCPYCTMEKQYLSNKGISFETVLVDEDRMRAMEMVQKTGQMGVPVTLIMDDAHQEHIIIGFDKNRIDRVLGL